MTPLPFLDIEAYIAACDGDPDAAWDWMQAYMSDDFADIPDDIKTMLRTHTWSDSTADEIGDIADGDTYDAQTED